MEQTLKDVAIKMAEALFEELEEPFPEDMKISLINLYLGGFLDGASYVLGMRANSKENYLN